MRKQSEDKTSLKQSEKTIRQEAREQLVELNDQQLDMVAGGDTKGKGGVTSKGDYPEEAVSIAFAAISLSYFN
jgi:hypothetical protein